MISIKRYHDISCGHRVVGHEGKCRSLHGHNYRITFHASAPDLDGLGRVIDFSVIKEKLCMWLEDTWDHKTLLWDEDPLVIYLAYSALLDRPKMQREVTTVLDESIQVVPFNPTAEAMASHLLNIVGPHQLAGLGVYLTKVEVEETRKCSAIAELDKGE